MALTDKLTAIADAIRAKDGSTALLTLDEMPEAIAAIEIPSIPDGGGSSGSGDSGIPEEAFTITGDCSYRFANNGWNWFVELFANKITTKDITNATYIFNKCSNLNDIPFTINLKANTQNIEVRYAFFNDSNITKVRINVPTTSSLSDLSYMFGNCSKLKDINSFSCNHTTYKGLDYLFYYCTSIEQLPYIYNAYPSSLYNMFSECQRLRAIPEDYFDTWNFSRMDTYGYSMASGIFNGCISLRQIPQKILNHLVNNTVEKSGSYNAYSNMFNRCYTLDEIVGLPVDTVSKHISNIFSTTIPSNHRLKNFTFATNEDGSPKVAQWKLQTLNFADNFTGYASNASNITGFNSGITADKEVKDDATYQALKDNPDWFTCNVAYSRYNHDSAVATINSLPNTIAFGTNTIKFNGKSGSATDGGAINTLTEEEIAVAAAKGWTVTLT